jgi:Fe-S-cluster-containing hydrogenase component 2/CRP-like cAMP-binding protein
VQLEFDRLVARLGAQPPSHFLEACGLRLDSGDRVGEVPISENGQSLQVPGLFIIGAVSGNPLIKQCLDQGYRVVESILGNETPSADQELIRAQLERAGESMAPRDLVQMVGTQISLFRALSTARVAQLLGRAQLRRISPGVTIFERGERTNTLFALLEGEVAIELTAGTASETLRLSSGRSFGEAEVLWGGRRRVKATAIRPSLLVALERDAIRRVAPAAPGFAEALGRGAASWVMQSCVGRSIPEFALAEMLRASSTVRFQPGEAVISEAAADPALYFLCNGAVIARRPGESGAVADYLSAGNWVGAWNPITGLREWAQVEAVIQTEAVRVGADALRAVLDAVPQLRSALAKLAESRSAAPRRARPGPQSVGAAEFVMRERLAGAGNLPVIDESLCIGCDNCEKACAETHGGISRLDRQAGPGFASLRVPAACRHCEDAPCASACPAGAMRFAASGEVFVDAKACVGCGDCERACDYGAITMAAAPVAKPGLLKWLLFGRGPGPGEDKSAKGLAARAGPRHPAKCDLCRDVNGGPACVSACPTGAVFRAPPDQLIPAVLQAAHR